MVIAAAISVPDRRGAGHFHDGAAPRTLNRRGEAVWWRRGSRSSRPRPPAPGVRRPPFPLATGRHARPSRNWRADATTTREPLRQAIADRPGKAWRDLTDWGTGICRVHQGADSANINTTTPATLIQRDPAYYGAPLPRTQAGVPPVQSTNWDTGPEQILPGRRHRALSRLSPSCYSGGDTCSLDALS